MALHGEEAADWALGCLKNDQPPEVESALYALLASAGTLSHVAGLLDLESTEHHTRVARREAIDAIRGRTEASQGALAFVGDATSQGALSKVSHTGTVAIVDESHS